MSSEASTSRALPRPVEKMPTQAYLIGSGQNSRFVTAVPVQTEPSKFVACQTAGSTESVACQAAGSTHVACQTAGSTEGVACQTAISTEDGACQTADSPVVDCYIIRLPPAPANMVPLWVYDPVYPPESIRGERGNPSCPRTWFSSDSPWFMPGPWPRRR